MDKGRIEAFSDGVIAIIITIMVLFIKTPQGSSPAVLIPLIPVFISYSLSYTFVGIYWNNHHHLFQAVDAVDGAVLWANLVQLFWLSMIPFVTDWMGHSGFAKWPVICYGLVLIFNAIANAILVKTLLRLQGKNSLLAEAFGDNRKGKLTIVTYIVGIALCFIHPWLGFAVYIIIAGIWIVPDKRIENKMLSKESTQKNL